MAKFEVHYGNIVWKLGFVLLNITEDQTHQQWYCSTLSC